MKKKTQKAKVKSQKHAMGKVVVGLSGGVDSSVSAALLIEAGYDVTGVFLECWRAPGCRVDEDRKDALDVAIKLGIPYQVLDFKQAYKDRVVEYFYTEYEAGRTPNPDTMCNREIKFGLFYDWAMENGFDAVATGHYARVLPIKQSNTQSSYALARGIDPKKDQSYFLYLLRQDQLSHVLFPIGHLTKTQVREEATKRGLATATKPDSQGICFIGEVNVHNFLKERISEKPGEIHIQATNKEFVVIGTHTGVPFYTIGQKVGRELDQAKLAKLSKKGVLNFDPTTMPSLFVIDKDIETNILIVGTEEETKRDVFQVSEINPLVDTETFEEKIRDCYVRIRHGGELVRASVSSLCSDELSVELEHPLKGIASGQACVFYSNDKSDAIVLGGGIII